MGEYGLRLGEYGLKSVEYGLRSGEYGGQEKFVGIEMSLFSGKYLGTLFQCSVVTMRGCTVLLIDDIVHVHCTFHPER